MKLYFAAGCPYAHRSRALLVHLGQEFEEREIDLANKPADFLAVSPTGKVPLLVDDDFVLYESAVINEYLAEKLHWVSAFDEDVQERARERLAMVQFDQALNHAFFKYVKQPERPLDEPIVKELQQLEATVRGKNPERLLGFHMATFWLRWNWLLPDAQLVQRIKAMPALRGFLDAAVAMPAIQKTAPDREPTVMMMRKHFGLTPN